MGVSWSQSEARFGVHRRPVYDEAAKEVNIQLSMCEFRPAKDQTQLPSTKFSGSQPLPIGKSRRPSFTAVAVSSAIAQKPRLKISVCFFIRDRNSRQTIARPGEFIARPVLPRNATSGQRITAKPSIHPRDTSPQEGFQV